MIQMPEFHFEDPTLFKVDSSCKIYFFQECKAEDLMKEFFAGRAVIIQKKEGKRSVFATEEIANQLLSGALTLKGKKGNTKEIDHVTVVDIQFFLQLIQASTKPAEAHTDAVQSTPATQPKVTRRVERMEKVDALAPTKILLSIVSKAVTELAELFVALEEARIIDRLRKKNEEAALEARELVRRDVERYELRLANQKQLQRIKSN